MSLAANPHATYPVTLPTDAGLPEDQRPTFIVRHMTGLQWIEFCEFADDRPALEALNIKDVLSALHKRISARLVSWKHVKDPDQDAPPERELPFDLARLPDVLALDDAWDLYYEIRRGARISAQEKNASSPPSPKPTGSSVPTAGQVSALAAPTPSAPQSSSAQPVTAVAVPSAGKAASA